MDGNIASASYVSVALIAISTIPSIWRLAKRPFSVKTTNDGLYEDEDGAATEESMAQYRSKQSFTLIFGATATGLGFALALAIFATVRRNNSFSHLCLTQLWLLFAAWMLMILQIFATSLERHHVTRFQRAAFNLVSCFFIAVLASTVLLGQMPHRPDVAALVVITIAQIVAAATLAFALGSIERRPDVFRPDGHLVERQFQGPLWRRYTFSWSSDILDLAATKLIEADDLPAPDSTFRTKDAVHRFRSIALKPHLPLFTQVFWTFRYQLLWLWAITAISTAFDVAPQFAMLKVLQFLEARKDFNPINPEAWFWVAVMFTVTVSSTLIDYSINWATTSQVAIPIRATIQALLFEKMMKLKDIKKPPISDEGSTENPEMASGGKNSKEASAKPLKTQRDTINMFNVDTNMVASLGVFGQFYISFACRLFLVIVFLWLLIGWQSMSAGITSLVIASPVNYFLGKRYAKIQKNIMEARDRKTTIITEALQGIRQIKFSAIERQWSRKIDEVRENELQMIWNARLNNIMTGFASDITPVLFAVFCLATYSYIYGDLLPSVAFTALSLFMRLEGLAQYIPRLLIVGVNAKVSSDRITRFLQKPEKTDKAYPSNSVYFDKATISFPSESEKDDDEDRFVLRDITLDFPNGALSVISGPTGSGKSLLLAAILGEAEILSGNIRVPRPALADERFDSKATAANWILPSSISFVSQTPWIENATIKNNILFGLPFDPTRYDKVVKACALQKDLDMFEDGDLTEVGAQGITLSGGQKWRLTLARAFYSRAGLLILDDVFSALDAHVGKDIYDNAIMGELSNGRTRILVTHHVSLCLPRATYAVRLGARGTLEYAGLTEQLQSTGNLDSIFDANGPGTSITNIGSSISPLHEQNQKSVTAEISNDPPAQPKPTPKKLVDDEHRETGSVKKSVYVRYLNATGGATFWIFVFAVHVLSQALTMSRSWWIKIWTASYKHSTTQMIHLTNTYYFQTLLLTPTHNSTMLDGRGTNQTLRYYLSIYVAISMVSVFVVAGRVYLIYSGSLSGSRTSFQSMTYSVLRTPLRWLDTVPTGRILNRFTTDVATMDSALALDFADLAGSSLHLVGVLVAALFVSPYMIILSLILLGICTQISRQYLQGARPIKRLQSIQRSPMISHFSSSFEGISTIRAFSNSTTFVTHMHSLIDSYSIAWWHNMLYNTWVSFRLALVGSIFSTAVAAFVVASRGVDASLAGFALAFAIDFRVSANKTIRLVAITELEMNSAERIFEYSNLKLEKMDGIDNLRASWPEEGKLEINDLEVGYAADLPSILKGLTFSAASNQRIGVVGRTGAGKSTLSLALFRFLEARKGSIIIDGIDISTIKLHDLRTRLAIIPQDPVLFSGTIRSNLDPFDDFSDVQLREALQRVHLVPFTDSTPVPESETIAESSTTTSSTAVTIAEPEVKENTNIFLSLSSPISSGGSNISQGQKQLLCLARAILSRPRLLLLDEATSAVDMKTDILIQRSIREEFANTTLLVVAHRLTTVVDFDMIVVMRDGVAAEFGSPKELLEIEDGVFKGMVMQSGDRDELEKTILRA